MSIEEAIGIIEEAGVDIKGIRMYMVDSELLTEDQVIKKARGLLGHEEPDIEVQELAAQAGHLHAGQLEYLTEIFQEVLEVAKHKLEFAIWVAKVDASLKEVTSLTHADFGKNFDLRVWHEAGYTPADAAFELIVSLLSSRREED